MPNIVDATVVASAFDTSGNGGRKLVKLDNGWLVALVKDTSVSSRYYLYVSKDNMATLPSRLCTIDSSGTSMYGGSITSFGNRVYFSHGMTGSGIYCYVINAVTQTDVNIFSSSNPVDPYNGTYTVTQTSMVVNATIKEIHLSYNKLLSGYSSQNTFYIKGIISAVNGSVSWGTVEQVTNANASGIDFKNPSIILKDLNLVIISERVASTSYIIAYSKDFVSNDGAGYATGLFKAISIYYAIGYVQSSPSAIFVPQSINGLTSGRIWVGWHGSDSTDTSVYNIMLAYSDDLGVTWTVLPKLTSGNTIAKRNVSLSANRNNKLFITYGSYQDASIQQISYDGTTWSAPITLFASGTNTDRYPSTLFDLSFDFSKPLLIYKGISSVLFSGTWTVTTISITQGSIGLKTDADKSNLLSYAITTDGTMSTITEAINGVVVGTKTATSGESLIAGLTQIQWDAVKYGKYKDVTGGLNTLTVTMGTDVFTYTFDKRPASDADITSAIKAVEDTQSVYLPAVKAKLASAIRGKGGTVNDTDAWDAMVSSVVNTNSKMWASITKGTDLSTGILTVTGLPFKPSAIFLDWDDGTYQYRVTYRGDVNVRINQGRYATPISGTLGSGSFSGSWTGGDFIISADGFVSGNLGAGVVRTVNCKIFE